MKQVEHLKLGCEASFHERMRELCIPYNIVCIHHVTAIATAAEHINIRSNGYACAWNGILQVLSAQSTYNKRYKFSGNFNINYLKSIYGEKGDPDYSSSTNFQVIWSHSQDSKANPNMSLSASVNFTTSGYSRNNVNSYYSSAFTENTKSSTVNLT